MSIIKHSTAERDAQNDSCSLTELTHRGGGMTVGVVGLDRRAFFPGLATPLPRSSSHGGS